MPKYMLILRSDTTVDYAKFTPADFEKILGEFTAWGEKVARSGNLVLGHKLTDQGGKVIVPKGAQVTVKDGPYVETKEVVGGYYIVKADSYDHALKLCQGHPNLRFGSIEIREVDFLGGPED